MAKKFKYIVITEENKQLYGTIGATDEGSARKELNELGFSIVSIEEIAETPTEETTPEEASDQPVITFEFLSLDKNNRHIKGTIQAADKLSAYKRLIEEYEFEVQYLYDIQSTPEQIEQEKIHGVYELQNQVDAEKQLIKRKVTTEEKDLKEFEERQATLKSQIDYVLNKVKELLDEYEADMSPEIKEKIRSYVDKILRIRNSTNLDYVKKTAEEMLIFLQKEEIFLHKETKMKERAKMIIEAKSMMLHLKSSKSSSKKGITEQLLAWRRKHFIEEKNTSTINTILNFFASFIIGFTSENDDILAKRAEIKTLNRQIKQYIILYFQSPSQELKSETKQAILRLYQERKKLINELKLLKIKQSNTNEKNSPSRHIYENVLKEIYSLSGWLLFFYFIYYFLGNYLTHKQFNTENIPYIFNIFSSNLLKYFFFSIFLTHSVVSVKLNFLAKNRTADFILCPLLLISILLFYLNF